VINAVVDNDRLHYFQTYPVIHFHKIIVWTHTNFITLFTKKKIIILFLYLIVT